VKDLPIVFVVDDDPAVMMSLDAVLKVEGYTVKFFSSAEEFLAQHRPMQVGCILIDLILPKMSGNELWQRIHRSGSLLSVIILSGWIESLDLNMQRVAPAPLIEKPYEVQTLLAAVADGIATSMLRKAKRDRHG
jgi:two-component system response regulator FixJ